jgi:hypothetical protein
MVHITGFSSFWISLLQSILLLLCFLDIIVIVNFAPIFFIIAIALLHFVTQQTFAY